MSSYPSTKTTPCMICVAPTIPHTTKRWGGVLGLADVLMSRCMSCGFVQAETIRAMSDERWERLNVECHSLYQGSDENPTDPRWLDRMTAQRDVLASLYRLNVTPAGKPWLDRGCGDAKLSRMLRPLGVPLESFDAYMGGSDYLREEDLMPKLFGLVISTSVFEHVRSPEPLDEMEELVADTGIFVIHTLIAEDVPDDPDWFYYQAPHVSFFTNESMRVLFERWGYRSSVYHLSSKFWFCLREPEERARELAARLNVNLGTEDAVSSPGFMGYWTNARLGVLPKPKFSGCCSLIV